MNRYTLSRRRLMQGGAALTGAAALGLPAGGAHAQSKGRIVIGTWGGDYARLLHKNIEEPILIPEGWEVIQDQAGDPQRRSKMLAEKMLPRGTTDVQGLSAINMYNMNEAGVLGEIDYDMLQNAPDIIPSMRWPYGVGHIYSGKVAVYNPEVAEKAPKSYKDVFDPSLGESLGIIDIQYQYTMMAAAIAAGGSVDDFEPGKKLLLEVRKAGAKIYPTNEAFAQGLKANEFGTGIMWKARTVQWQNAGINVKSVVPEEGAIAYVSGFVIPKNAPNREGAHAYLDAMLEPSAQENFAKDMGYNPTVTDAEISPELRERIGFTPEEIDGLIGPDFAYITANDVAMKEWWDKEFKGQG